MGFIERLVVPWLGCAAPAYLRDEMKQPDFKSVHLPVGDGCRPIEFTRAQLQRGNKKM
jgi:hypothetical protein